MNNDDLMKAQISLEAEMASLGVDRFRRMTSEAKQEGRATAAQSVRVASDSLAAPLAKAIDQYVNADRGKGRRPRVVACLADIDPMAVAMMTTNVVLDRLIQSQNFVSLAQRVGSMIELEARLVNYAKINRPYLRAVEADLNARTGHTGVRMAVFRKMVVNSPDNWDPWGKPQQIVVGSKLIELLASSTGMLEIVNERRGKRELTVVRTTDRFNRWLASLDDRLELLTPEYMPCIMPPKPWTSFTDGGYHTDAFAFPITLVKTRRKAHVRELLKADLSTVMKAVNGVQNTPWAVNEEVLDVVRQLVASHYEGAGLISMEDEKVPTPPADIDTNEEARIAWKRQATRVHQANAKATSRRFSMLKTVTMAEKFKQYDRIYFPHQMDFRGRLYSVPQTFCPQGQDLAKGLLRFAEGAPIKDTEAHRWFLIHGANSFGIDKEGFDDRIKWVWENETLIERTAADPLDDLWWTGADSPFCFLAWCFEFARYNTRDENFLSYLAPAMDGTCNGLQHYSAMLRDPVAGKAVNLVPSDKPQDIYAEVAKVAMSTLYRTGMMLEHPALADATNLEEIVKEANMANAWGAFGIDRKITKRPVMVLPYGGTLSSCQQYVREAVEEKLRAGVALPIPEDEFFQSCNWLANIVWSSIGEVVVSARLAMSFLQDCATTMSHNNLPIKWVTPTGFPVVQGYPETKMHRIETKIMGRRFRPSFLEDNEGRVDPRRQRNSIAPNFVHSMDASALVLTVNAALDAGITRFAMIHDSYGTDVSRSADLARILRKAFVSMYEDNDVLEQFREQCSSALGEEADTLQSPPHVGGLDLSSVMESKYFFA